MYIKDIETGKPFNGLRAVLAAATPGSKNNRSWLNVTIKDGADTIQGKIWNWDVNVTLPEIKKVYLFSGRGDEYMGNKQAIVDKYILDIDQDQTAFNVTSEADGKLLWESTKFLIDMIKNDKLHDFIYKLYTYNAAEIKGATSAANNHHVGVYGNLLHSYEVATLSCAIGQCIKGSAKHTGIEIPEISNDLLIAGGLCHDIGKYKVYAIDGPVITYTMEGQLFDHIYAGCQIIRDAAHSYAPLDTPILELLEHIILSHHGKMEYGSPVCPRFIEAHIIAVADNISASTNAIITANTKAGENPLTDKIYTENNAIHLTQEEVRRRLEYK